MRVLTLTIDQYTPEGVCTGFVISARAVECDLPAPDLLDQLLAETTAPLRTLSYAECVQHLAARRSTEPDPWEQLSIF